MAVTLVQVDATAQTVDPTTREPVRPVPTRTPALRGQVKELRCERLKMTGAGANAAADAKGRVVFDRAALAAGVQVALGTVL